MISFYPGPSKVWDRLPHYMEDAWAQGMLSVNHRSPEFTAVAATTISLLHEKLHIPDHYTILFTSSATESWEIIAQSLIGEAGSLHLYNGAFGEKWFEYTNKITKNAYAAPFLLEELPEPAQLALRPKTQLIALTHNETSNGTALPDSFMKEIRATYPNQLIAVDATSSMAGANLPFEMADIWFASVQKCFGLPAGLAVMVCSPQAIERAKELDENRHYNSLLFMHKMIADAQTTYTPNVLGIYLLMRSLQDRPAIEVTSKILHQRFEGWIKFFEQFEALSLLVKNPELRSPTVLPIQASPEEVEAVKKSAKAAGFYLGNGYGNWKNNTFRIANFPAHTDQEIQQLKDFLKNFNL